MIKKLRFRFAISVILSALLILVVLIGAINIVNYRRVVSDADRELDMFSTSGMADVPELPEGAQMPDPNGQPPPDDRVIMPPMFMPETNTYSAVYDADGNRIDSFTSWNSMFANDTMEQYAQQVLSLGKERGFIGDCRYIKQTQNGSTLVVLIDCGPGLNNFRNFLKYSILFSLGCLVIISIAAVIVSGKAVKPVAESYEKQKRFITDAGHEIKTPLAIINADADVLLSDLGDDNEWVTDIKTQTRRLSALTNDLIRLSKMEEGKKSLNLGKVDLAQIVAEQVNSFKSIAASDDKEFVLSCAGNVKTEGDADALRALVSILLDNAVKYSPEGGKIDVSCRAEDRLAVLEVGNSTADSLEEDVLEKLFDRFYRADASRNSDKGGYGIGLATAKATADAHGGNISAHKKSDKQIVFAVTLPLSQ